MLSEVKNTQAYGNEEVVKLFEIWLKRARGGQICHATITVCQLPNLMACDFAGVADMEYAVPFVLDTLKLKLYERARISSGPPDKGLTADYVCYNLASSPKSFDFLIWLIDAEMTRRREGAPSPLKVAFTKGQDGKSGIGSPQEQQMFVNVMKPLIKLVGGIEDQRAVGGRASPWYVLRNVTRAAKQEQVPHLQASDEARETVRMFLKDGPSPVTVTLRELDSWGHRNSNIEAWKKFADSTGERVIFIRDTAKAGDPILGCMTFPLASLNLDIRMALYEQAKCNLFVPSGPWNLALFGDRPWLMFNKISEDDPYIGNRPKFWEESQGIKEGEQFPWSGPNQRIVWKPDTYENISEAWSWLAPRLEMQRQTQETLS